MLRRSQQHFCNASNYQSRTASIERFVWDGDNLIEQLR